MTDPREYAPPATRQQVAPRDPDTKELRESTAYVREAAAWVAKRCEEIKLVAEALDNRVDLPVDPVVGGLLDHLPRAGSVWPATERKQWIALLEGTFNLIYKDAATGDGQ